MRRRVEKYVIQNSPLTLRLQNHRSLSLTSSTTATVCVCVCARVHTSYEEGGLERNVGPSETTTDTLVGPSVPGLDLGDQQCAVG